MIAFYKILVTLDEDKELKCKDVFSYIFSRCFVLYV